VPAPRRTLHATTDAAALLGAELLVTDKIVANFVETMAICRCGAVTNDNVDKMPRLVVNAKNAAPTHPFPVGKEGWGRQMRLRSRLSSLGLAVTAEEPRPRIADHIAPLIVERTTRPIAAWAPDRIRRCVGGIGDVAGLHRIGWISRVRNRAADDGASSKRPRMPNPMASLAAVDTVVHLSREMILRKIYPGVDVRTARSRLIDENRIAAGDVALARSARDAITAARMAEDHPELARDPVLIDRARKLQAFFSQPFYVAEPVTKRLGSHVSREEGAKRGKTNTALSAIDGQRKARAALVDDRNREAGAPGKPEGGTRQCGRPKPPDGDRGGADPLCR